MRLEAPVSGLPLFWYVVLGISELYYLEHVDLYVPLVCSHIAELPVMTAVL